MHRHQRSGRGHLGGAMTGLTNRFLRLLGAVLALPVVSCGPQATPRQEHAAVRQGERGGAVQIVARADHEASRLGFAELDPRFWEFYRDVLDGKDRSRLSLGGRSYFDVQIYKSGDKDFLRWGDGDKFYVYPGAGSDGRILILRGVGTGRMFQEIQRNNWRDGNLATYGLPVSNYGSEGGNWATFQIDIGPGRLDVVAVPGLFGSVRTMTSGPPLTRLGGVVVANSSGYKSAVRHLLALREFALRASDEGLEAERDRLLFESPEAFNGLGAATRQCGAVVETWSLPYGEPDERLQRPASMAEGYGVMFRWMALLPGRTVMTVKANGSGYVLAGPTGTSRTVGSHGADLVHDVQEFACSLFEEQAH